MSESLGHKAAKGAVWATIDRFGSMAISFIVNLMLAHILLPSDFGMIGVLAIFIVVSQTLIDGGFSTALIQKKETTQTDYSTIFYWNLVLALILYAILFFSAPLVARLFHSDALCGVLRVVGLSLLFSAVNSVQVTRLRKSFGFNTLACINLISNISSGIIAICLAYNGYGVWSLVIFQLSMGFFNVLLTAIITKWHPSAEFSLASLKSLFGFGGYILAANVLQTICQNFQGVIIGRKFSTTQMGYYSQAYKLDQVTSYSLPQIIVQVMYPLYSTLQDDREKLSSVLLMNLRIMSVITFMLLGFLMLSAEPLILLLYGEKWLPSVPYFRILCVGGLFVCLQNLNFYAVAAVGKSRQLFKWSFYKWGFLLTALLVGSGYGMYGILWGMVASNINIYITNGVLVSRYVGLRFSCQLGALARSFAILAVAMVASVTVSYFIVPEIIFACACFVIIYVLGSVLFNKTAVAEARSVVDVMIRKISR